MMKSFSEDSKKSNTITSVKSVSENTNTADECCSICSLCGVGILTLSIAGGIIAYYTFGIMYLVEDYKTCKECQGSHLWEAILVSLIISLFTGNAAKNNSDEESNKLCLNLCSVIISIGINTWLGIELFDLSCSSVEETNLWTFGYVVFIINCVIVGILVLLSVLLCFGACCSYKNDPLTEKAGSANPTIQNYKNIFPQDIETGNRLSNISDATTVEA